MAEAKGSLEVPLTLPPMPGKPRDVPHRPPDHRPLQLTVSKRGSRPNSASIDSVINTLGTAIPPRSRYGCWTCRQRKVKCDELRPSCTPCTRLGHTCDYNPRLVFRDDTRRVIRQMKNRGCTESLAWNGGLPDSVVLTMLIRGNLAFSVVEEIPIQDADKDHLPPFSSLTNDEDREKKAEFQAPGTYNIIVNPSSFVDLEEYRESNDYSNRASGWKHSSLDQLYHTRNKTGISSLHSNKNLQEDPNVVILEKFEGDPVIMPVMDIRHAQSGASVEISQSSSRQLSPRATLSPLFDETVPAQIFLQIPPGKDDDRRLITHFNRFVLPSTAQVHRDALGTQADTDTLLAHEVFAQNAAHFSPLYHALMALTALSMDNRGGVQNLDALQHYQKALPSLHDSLRTPEDLSSDHVLLTHFVLLLYEIAASEPEGPNLRSRHLDQVLRIIKLRNGTRKRELYSFIPWWVLVIDAHAVLTGGGDGLYAESLMRDNLLPESLPPVQSTALSPISSPEASQTSVLKFHRELYIHATELGLLARNFRRQDAETALRGNVLASDEMQQLVLQARENLQRMWETHYPDFKARGFTNEQVAVKDRAIFEHTTILYSALIIYSYTSMWPTQTSTNPLPPFVKTHAHLILSLSREIVTAGHLERKFVVFPLFMAGILFSSCYSSEFAAHRAETVRLLKDLERKTMGKIANASRLLLELVYEKIDRGKGTGTRVVDWVGLAKDKGLQVVNCRL